MPLAITVRFGVLIEISLIVIAIFEGESSMVPDALNELPLKVGLICSIIHLSLSVGSTQFITLAIVPSLSSTPYSNCIFLCGKGLVIIIGL